MADLGSDFSCVTDLDSRLSVVSGREGLAQAAARRLGTPAGGLFYDLSYGASMANLSGKAVRSTGMLAARGESELLKDERIDNAQIAFTTDPDTGALNPSVTLTDGAGPFALTDYVSNLTLQQILGG